MLGRNIILASTALVASLALTACDNNGGGGVGTLEFEPAVMSATHGSVTVKRGDADLVVNDFDPLTGDFSVTLTLADGVTEVTMTEADLDVGPDITTFDFINNPWPEPDLEGIRVKLDNGDDEVILYIGLVPGADADALNDGENVADIIDATLFVMAAIDPDGVDGGFNSYIVAGEQTDPDAMPAEGGATYNGITRASLYTDGVLIDDNEKGEVEVIADFLNDKVDITLSDGIRYNLTATGVDIEGSLYEGLDALSGTVNPIDGNPDFADGATGDVIGAFYGEGDVPAATAGVFGATETEDGYLLEVVGSFGAYQDEPEP